MLAAWAGSRTALLLIEKTEKKIDSTEMKHRKLETTTSGFQWSSHMKINSKRLKTWKFYIQNSKLRRVETKCREKLNRENQTEPNGGRW